MICLKMQGRLSDGIPKIQASRSIVLLPPSPPLKKDKNNKQTKPNPNKQKTTTHITGLEKKQPDRENTGSLSKELTEQALSTLKIPVSW